MVIGMLITTINESSPIYQFCENCVNQYISTGNDEWIDSILIEANNDDVADGLNWREKRANMSPEEQRAYDKRQAELLFPDHHANMIKAIMARENLSRFEAEKYAREHNIKVEQEITPADDPILKTMGPIEARDFLTNKLGSLASRSRVIDIHQPQNKFFGAAVFWNHPKTQKVLSNLPKIGLGVGLAGIAGEALYRYKFQPKTVIAKKIASLRKILYKLRAKMRVEKNRSSANILQKVCVKIGNAIDKLLEFMQKKSDKLFRKESIPLR